MESRIGILSVLSVLGLVFTLAGCAPPPVDSGVASATAADAQSRPAELARLSWDAPTTRTDGTCLHDLQGFVVLWGQAPDRLANRRDLTVEQAQCRSTGTQSACGGVQRCSVGIGPLGSGTWYFAVRAKDGVGQESPLSETVSKSVGALER
jgi:hypothetical protein